jgi:hypothetical protein
VSDRLSRPERRTLQRQDTAILTHPLVLSQDPRQTAAHVRHVVHLLRAPQANAPCADAVAHVTALFDRSVPQSANKIIACRKGCAHCCTQTVAVTAPEAFAVASLVRKRPATVAAITAAAERTGKMALNERLTAGIMCPMLEDALCSVYAGRPLGCHGFVSASLDACIATFTQGGKPDIPMPNDTVQLLHVCRMLMLVAMRLAGLNDAVYELNAALAVALSQADAETRWLRGEDVFAGVKTEAPPPPQFEQAIRQMATYVAPTL